MRPQATSVHYLLPLVFNTKGNIFSFHFLPCFFLLKLCVDKKTDEKFGREVGLSLQKHGWVVGVVTVIGRGASTCGGREPGARLVGGDGEIGRGQPRQGLKTP